MATKLINKYATMIGITASLYLIALSLLSLVDIMNKREYIQNPDHYFHSSAFHNELTTYFNLLESYYTDNKHYVQWSVLEKVGETSYKQIQKKYEDIYQAKTNEINEAYKAELEANPQLPDEQRMKLEEKRDLELAQAQHARHFDFEETIAKIVKARDQQFQTLKDSLEKRNNSFKYYIRDTQTTAVYTNIDNRSIEDYIKTDALYSLHFPKSSFTTEWHLRNINQTFEDNQWEGYIIVPKLSESSTAIHQGYTYYESIRERVAKEGILLVFSLSTAMGILVVLANKQKLNHPWVSLCHNYYRRLPIDMRTLVFIMISLIIIGMANIISFFQFPFTFTQIFFWTFISLLSGFLLLYLVDTFTLLKNRTELKQEWDKSFYKQSHGLLKESMQNKQVFYSILFIILSSIGLGIFVMVGIPALRYGAGVLIFSSFVYIFVYCFIVIPFVLKRIGLLNRILKGSQEIAAGNIQFRIEETGKGQLSALASHINTMRSGFESALEKQLKSERMKTELITNVSHDLKTPLTSIINYVDLLKTEDLSLEKKKQYLDVLERKTQRLKTLIDDLFEASKVASGAVDLEIQQVDVGALLNQALAEYHDQIEQSTLTFRIKLGPVPVYVPLDGNKTWRAFENLISNALKYSQTHTRVYISVDEQEEHVVISMKNTSAYEIDFDVEELFERFKRGDQSRNTEGSGLGLAIAKNIVELHGGNLSIEIDGDLFKVFVTLPKTLVQ
ncbi:HAMP domain-containing sensor histidine kinase [Ammoniphilus sp. CFH 90114]|uniref:HAMP domain-containing sensor histidine kinase n=1 Tax=Ammoniphilus sp. CFH 90114 TaxID=2493665 RepID=UPI00100EE583|nr:HAMP domain-containing sensor histidine kinase [Ammoniphilus sp. CFH 90114]RXT15365.1 HAMP domain-containing histidine kinase [Ammoniphilus sp. CFH 90114]